jgi:hypothetical protein
MLGGLKGIFSPNAILESFFSLWFRISGTCQDASIDEPCVASILDRLDSCMNSYPRESRLSLRHIALYIDHR